MPAYALYLLPMGFNKQPIPPYTVCTCQELFRCMNTAFMIEADSQTCIGVHINTAYCCLVILCTSVPVSLSFQFFSQLSLLLLLPLLNPILVTTTSFAVSPFPTPHTSLPLSFPSLPFSISLPPSELRGGSWQVTRVVKPDELGRPDESLRKELRKLEHFPQEGEDTHTLLMYMQDTLTAVH